MEQRTKLQVLSDLYAIATSYTDFQGNIQEVTDETLIKTLRAFGADLGPDPVNEASITKAITDFHDHEFTQPLPPCVVTPTRREHVVHVHVHDGEPADVYIELEDGTTRQPNQIDNWTSPRLVNGILWGEASFQLPDDLPLGWHQLHLKSTDITASCALVVTPAQLSTTEKILNQPQPGVMAQLYSVRSATSWGIGDFHDLGLLATQLATDGFQFLLINPIHAGQPIPPIEDSPYLPISRRFINPIYLRVEEIPEYKSLPDSTRSQVEKIATKLRKLNYSPDLIERNPIFSAKLDALAEIFQVRRTPERQAEFTAFIQREGDGLVEFARWCAKYDIAQRSGNHALAEDAEELVDFYMWLQWLCDEQLAHAQQSAKDAGMSIGIITDVAVGVHPEGADAYNLSNVLAPAASVGAPPDGYNQQGQDWSQPPWNPRHLAQQSYLPWRQLLQAALRHAGGVRVDHVLGLFRLFVIPRGQSPQTGTYIHFDYEAMVGILALEAERAGAVVIGEDLGTFEPYVQDILRSRGILSTSILWFESSPSQPGPRRQHEYVKLALTSVTTHDLPPTAGYLAGEHIELRKRLGLFTHDSEIENSMDLEWQNQVLNCVAEAGELSGDFTGKARDDRGELSVLLPALHRFIAGTPSALTCTSLVDMVGDYRAQNQPGTTRELYPNWCLPLSDSSGNAVTIETLPDNELYQELTKAAKRH